MAVIDLWHAAACTYAGLILSAPGFSLLALVGSDMLLSANQQLADHEGSLHGLLLDDA
jgi:hypothetical protein